MKTIVAVLTALVVMLALGGISELEAQGQEVIYEVDFGDGVGDADDDVYASDETDMEEECRMNQEPERSQELDECQDEQCVDETSEYYDVLCGYGYC